MTLLVSVRNCYHGSTTIYAFCELLGDIMRKLEYIEIQVEDNGRQSIQFLRGRRELTLEENRRAYERQHRVIEIRVRVMMKSARLKIYSLTAIS
jgi:hypothetical protein